MPEEIEVKFLNVNPRKLAIKLKAVGARKLFDRIYKRRVYDHPDWRLDRQGAWLRVRDEGDKVVLAFKQRLGIKSHGGQHNDKGMEEIETTVGSFKNTCRILARIGLKEKFYEEDRKIRFMKDGVEYDIDRWPGIPPYLEIEAPSWKRLNAAVKELGFNAKDQKIFSTMQVYKLYGINEKDYKEVTFAKPPIKAGLKKTAKLKHSQRHRETQGRSGQKL